MSRERKHRGLLSTATLMSSLVLGLAFPLPASAQEGFSGTELTIVRSLPKAERAGESCLGFEAEFSGPVKGIPNGRIDIEIRHLIEGVVTRVLEMLPVSPDRYRFLLRDAEACKALKDEGQQVSISILEAQGADGLPLFPDQRTFTVLETQR